MNIELQLSGISTATCELGEGQEMDSRVKSASTSADADAAQIFQSWHFRESKSKIGHESLGRSVARGASKSLGQSERPADVTTGKKKMVWVV